MELSGRVAVVTGAASGIGLAMSTRFLAEGMAVVMADVEAPRLAAEAARLGPGAMPVVCDVGDPAHVERLRDAALARHGAVHLVCSNAGVAAGRPSLRTSPAVWRWMVDVNLLGVAYAVSAFAPGMVAQGEGHFVHTASEAGLCASPLLGAYHATKYAVVGLSEALALELAGTGVGVTCLCPELVDTRIFESTRNAPPATRLRPPSPVAIADVEHLMGTTAMTPADVAAAVVDAVRTNRFWLVTHAISRVRVRHRNADLEAGRNPSLPLPGPTAAR